MARCDFRMCSDSGRASYAPCKSESHYRIFYRMVGDSVLIRDWRKFCKKHVERNAETLRGLACMAEVEVREAIDGEIPVAHPDIPQFRRA